MKLTVSGIFRLPHRKIFSVGRRGFLRFWRGHSVEKIALQLCHLGVDVNGRSDNSYLFWG